MVSYLDLDGETYDAKRDGPRLSLQAQTVWSLMKDGRWRSIRHIALVTKQPEASVSARLRDLRKPKFGGYRVDRRYAGHGIWEYRVSEGVVDA